MFKIKGFYVFVGFLLSMTCQPVWAQPDTGHKTQDVGHKTENAGKTVDSCYAIGMEIKDTTVPCCHDLEALTEVGTKKKFCDVKPGASSAWWIWSLILIFPLFLLVFIIFGIRNKMALRKNQTPQ